MAIKAVFVCVCSDNSGGYSSRSLSVSMESWIGHPMDPIGCLFSVLLDAADSISAENRAGNFRLIGIFLKIHKKDAIEHCDV